MTPTSWQRLQDLFSEALELPTAERAGFVAKACADDFELRLRLQQMIGVGERPDNALENAVVQAAAALVLSDSPDSFSKAAAGERFLPGTLLAQRYRVVSLLGSGGMGEVYRADDLVLGQPVALKFLPAEWASDQAILSRFRNEVRIARQISHPNVCRVYDIGEAGECIYLSMEYVDGEDMASLLRRIGRLPQEKAIAIARQLCAGLAAAHHMGVIHRDLKPANIMLDGNGQLRITDFGLAGKAGELKDILSGTPAYMSPEQRAGRGVTARSDIYALGVVLHEVFTGRLPSANASEVDLPPEVDRVIRLCLEKDPERRPASPLSVSADLPGGDPLAVALAAGETPSPEMVAAAGDKNKVEVRTIAICLGSILVGLAAITLLGSKTNLLTKTPFVKSPAVLEQKAQDIVHGLGYTQAAVDHAFGFLYNTDYERFAQSQEKAADYREQLAEGQPALIYFWYRQSPRYLEATPTDDAFAPISLVSPINPPPVYPGMISLSLDTQGRLLEFKAVPRALEDNTIMPRPPDWTPLLTSTGLDMARFSPSVPHWIPPVSFDARAAWTGSYGHSPQLALRIEAASWRGRPVFFQIIGPWSKPDGAPPFAWAAGNLFQMGFLIFILLLAAFLSWRNIRRQRGDLRGAGRLAAFAFFIAMLSWLCGASHVPTPHEFGSFQEGLAAALWEAATFWVVYMALEPFVRRRWPAYLIGWSRLLSSGIRDPLTAGHVLIGAAFGIPFALQGQIFRVIAEQSGSLPTYSLLLNSLLGGRHIIVVLIDRLEYAGLLTLILLLFFSLLQLIFRRPPWAAVTFVFVCTALAVGWPLLSRPLVWANYAVVSALVVLVLVRWGVLALMTALVVFEILRRFPLTADFSNWYGASSLFPIAFLLVLSVWAGYTALAGRRLFHTTLLDSL